MNRDKAQEHLRDRRPCRFKGTGAMVYIEELDADRCVLREVNAEKCMHGWQSIHRLKESVTAPLLVAAPAPKDRQQEDVARQAAEAILHGKGRRRVDRRDADPPPPEDAPARVVYAGHVTLGRPADPWQANEEPMPAEVAQAATVARLSPEKVLADLAAIGGMRAEADRNARAARAKVAEISAHYEAQLEQARRDVEVAELQLKEVQEEAATLYAQLGQSMGLAAADGGTNGRH